MEIKKWTIVTMWKDLEMCYDHIEAPTVRKAWNIYCVAVDATTKDSDYTFVCAMQGFQHPLEIGQDEN